ncbi:hypothetical protein [Burkholderia ubonensis]|uniref:Uncharacterized protein n=1 Tax=Burkholderia ubonensis subsp. mesacidophila TaxID=265293 RepID=A0A2A4FA58_9BURK|nr:hypothetical protein [Burkholderia ubonensis]PCE30271.1 hypothetical protein BZL54_21515 [Burkholderia ubonensis subsp. mesacidophila]
MLKSLISGAVKSPAKLLALCLAVYIAAHSVLVFIFLIAATFNHFKNSAKSAPRSAERDSGDRYDVDEAPQQANRRQGASARSVVQASPTPQRQYAKSAVVIPMKARSSPTSAQSLKTGTK